MLDSDVAKLYHYETRRINEAVKRNQERFPEDFCFKLTENEYNILKSQFATSNEIIHLRGGKQKIPYVFTEKGIIMLSGMLKNAIAVEVSVKIVEAFIKMKNFINNNKNLLERVITIENRIDNKFSDYDNKFEIVLNELEKNKETEYNNKIFFQGQIYDAYELIIDVIKSAKKKIVLIDNYIDDTILKMVQKKRENVEVVIITSQNCNLTKIDIKKFNEQYPLLKIVKTNKFHDRFIIIDNEILYHCGASFKDLGKKCFAINKMEDKVVLNNMVSIYG